MSIPLELKQVFNRGGDDEISLDRETPDFFEKFIATAALAGVAGGFTKVESLRRETQNTDRALAVHYKKLAASAAGDRTKRLAKGGAPLQLFMPLLKMDVETRMVFGCATAEVADRDGEILDYQTSKPFFEQWSKSVERDSGGTSKGNIREMHQLSACGTIQQIQFDDAAKKINVAAKIVDDDAWRKCKEGVYVGFSVGGKYQNSWKDGGLTRYTANPCELSLVDRPCVAEATFSMMKSE